MSIFRSNLLENKSLVITGGSTGIGLQISKDFYRHGCNVCILSRNKNNLENSKTEIQSLKHLSNIKPKVYIIQCDVSNDKNVENAICESIKIFNKIDFLINSAAGNFLCPIENLS